MVINLAKSSVLSLVSTSVVAHVIRVHQLFARKIAKFWTQLFGFQEKISNFAIDNASRVVSFDAPTELPSPHKIATVVNRCEVKQLKNKFLCLQNNFLARPTFAVSLKSSSTLFVCVRSRMTKFALS